MLTHDLINQAREVIISFSKLFLCADMLWLWLWLHIICMAITCMFYVNVLSYFVHIILLCINLIIASIFKWLYLIMTVKYCINLLHTILVCMNLIIVNIPPWLYLIVMSSKNTCFLSFKCSFHSLFSQIQIQTLKSNNFNFEFFKNSKK